MVSVTSMRPSSEPLTVEDLDSLRYGGGKRELFDGVLLISREPDGFTPDDLADLPEDGRIHELLDGLIVVSPSPTWRHQEVVTKLLLVLAGALPADLRVVPAPLDVRTPEGSRPQPDLVVAVPPTTDWLSDPPLLAVEVLSPSGRARDLVIKRDLYARAGIRSYWIVDPEVPSVTMLDLGADGAYYVAAEADGDSEAVAAHPFPVSVVPSSLV